MEKAKTDVTYTLEGAHQEWLQAMATAHNLPNPSKALRVLIDYAIQDGDEKNIFETIRCARCG